MERWYWSVVFCVVHTACALLHHVSCADGFRFLEKETGAESVAWELSRKLVQGLLILQGR
jgi:hypothetical protein